MPKVKKQQDIKSNFRQEKKITSRYFKGKQNENDTTLSTESPTSRERERDLKALKEFDLNWEYGPCTGITRLERWERAEKHNLNPPKDVKELIKNHQEDNSYLQSLWIDYDL